MLLRVRSPAFRRNALVGLHYDRLCAHKKGWRRRATHSRLVALNAIIQAVIKDYWEGRSPSDGEGIASGKNPLRAR